MLKPNTTTAIAIIHCCGAFFRDADTTLKEKIFSGDVFDTILNEISDGIYSKGFFVSDDIKQIVELSQDCAENNLHYIMLTKI